MTDAALTVTADPKGPQRRRRWNALTISGAAILALLILIAIIAPIFLSQDAEALTDNASLPPSADHLLGTDSLGRDIFARTLVATRLTLLMTAAATVLSVVIGVTVGIGLWLSPRWLRETGLRVVDLAVTFPGILLALIIASIVGQGVIPAVIAIGLGGAPAFARLSANLSASVSQREFVQTARLLGVNGWGLATRHILPNMAEPMLILLTSAFGSALVDLSGLSFIGLGVQSPDFDFGFLLNDALHNIYTQPSQVVGPALMITITGLAIMLIGDGLAGAANPRSVALARSKGRSKKSAAAATHAPQTLPKKDELLSVENLIIERTDGFGLVKGISFHINRGEILGIVGESGSGKSLTAMSIVRLLPDGLTASARELQLDDINLLERVAPKRMALTTSLVYQDPGSTFNPALTMGSQLSDVLRRHLNMSKKEALERIAANFTAVQIVEPERRLRQHPHELSGGMRQRAMISASLNVDPLLLIADEPTTALDVTVQKEVLKIFKKANQQRGTSILFISHDIGVVQALCDRVIVMRGGEILEDIEASALAEDTVKHPYTKQLLAATPQVRIPSSPADLTTEEK